MALRRKKHQSKIFAFFRSKSPIYNDGWMDVSNTFRSVCFQSLRLFWFETRFLVLFACYWTVPSLTWTAYKMSCNVICWFPYQLLFLFYSHLKIDIVHCHHVLLLFKCVFAFECEKTTATTFYFQWMAYAFKDRQIEAVAIRHFIALKCSIHYIKYIQIERERERESIVCGPLQMQKRFWLKK